MWFSWSRVGLTLLVIISPHLESQNSRTTLCNVMATSHTWLFKLNES